MCLVHHQQVWKDVVCRNHSLLFCQENQEKINNGKINLDYSIENSLTDFDETLHAKYSFFLEQQFEFRPFLVNLLFLFNSDFRRFCPISDFGPI